MREWIARLLAVGRRGGRDRHLDDELRFHVDELTETYRRRGLDPLAAREAAEREFGGIGRARQAWRDQRTWLPLEELLQDVRYGWRMFRRSPGVTLLAGVTLAFAVAATTSVFAVVDAVLLAPLPYPAADQLVVVYEEYVTQHAPIVSVAPGNFFEWRDRARTFAAITAIEQRQQNLTSDGEPQQVTVGAVSQDFAATVDVRPVIGREFRTDEFDPARQDVALLGHAIWASRYGGDPGIIGRAITLDDRRYTVVGVMPAGFLFPDPTEQLWVPYPMTAADRENRTGHTLRVIGRLRSGVPFSTGARELRTIAEALQRDHPASNREWSVTPVPARDDLLGKTTVVLKAMMGAVGLLLLVACANVASLLLTHGLSRNREMAIRTAIGASRRRLAGQLLTESVLLASVAGAVGVSLAWAAQPLVASLRPEDFLAWKPIAIDSRALAFAIAATIASGVLFGTLPALLASSGDIGAAASDRAAGKGASHVRQTLVAFEVALAVVLLIGAALLGQTLAQLTQTHLGFVPNHVVTMRVSLPQTRYADDRRVTTFYDQTFGRIRTIPGVRAAGAIHALPLSGNTSVRPYRIDGGPSGDNRPVAHYRIVTPGYFEAMDIERRAGRFFDATDTADHPLAVIVNESLRRQAWGDQDAVGKRITFAGSNDQWATIVGVVGDIRHFGAGAPVAAEMYWSSAQIDAVAGPPGGGTLRRMRRQLTLVVNAEGDPAATVSAVRAVVKSIDSDQPVSSVRTMTSLANSSLWLSRASTWLLTVFSSAAGIFALLGVFGAASYAVVQRRRELAVRMALGATPSDVGRLVLVSALRGVVAGIAAGVLLAIALGRTVATLLVGIESTDARTFVAVSVALATMTTLACLVPVRRATRIDPMQALRTE